MTLSKCDIKQRNRNKTIDVTTSNFRISEHQKIAYTKQNGNDTLKFDLDDRKRVNSLYVQLFQVNKRKETSQRKHEPGLQQANHKRRHLYSFILAANIHHAPVKLWTTASGTRVPALKELTFQWPINIGTRTQFTRNQRNAKSNKE